MSKIFHILVFNVMFIDVYWSFAIRNKLLLSRPDFGFEGIPEKWRQLCGYRYIPYERDIEVNPTCFGSERNGSIIEKKWPDKSWSRVGARVQHGIDAEMHESPWTVQIAEMKTSYGSSHYGLQGNTMDFSHWCTGVLITMKHILTAANCHYPTLESPRKKLAIFAANNEAFDRKYLVSNENDFEYYPHPMYDLRDNDTKLDRQNRSDSFDIALIVLKKPINESEERFKINLKTKQIVLNTICLPMMAMAPDIDKLRPGTFFGWGRMANDTVATKLQKGDVEIKHGRTDYCQPQFCLMTTWESGYVTGCRGDTGAGLVQYLDKSRNRAFLVGILHQVRRPEGDDECKEGLPRVTQFTNVMKHLKWIRDMIQVTSHN